MYFSGFLHEFVAGKHRAVERCRVDVSLLRHQRLTERIVGELETDVIVAVVIVVLTKKKKKKNRCLCEMCKHALIQSGVHTDVKLEFNVARK